MKSIHDPPTLESIFLLKKEAEQLSEQGKLDAALRLLDQAAAAALNVADPSAMAYVWRGRANVYAFHGLASQCIDAVHAGIAAFHGTPHAEVNGALSRIVEIHALGELRRIEDAVALAEQIKPFVAPDSFPLALLLSNLGQAQINAWQNRDGLESCRAARQIFLKLAIPHQAARMLQNMAICAERLDQLSDARRWYEEAFAILFEQNDLYPVVKIQFNLALLLFREGNYQAALDSLAQARIFLAQLPHNVDDAWVDLREARVRRAMYQFDEAEKLLRSALEQFLSFDEQIEAARTLIELAQVVARSYTFTHLTEALGYLDRASELLGSREQPLVGAFVVLERSLLLYELGRKEEAAAGAQRAIGHFQRLGVRLQQARAETLLADCISRLEPSKGAQLYTDAFAHANHVDPLLATRCQRGLALMAFRQGDYEQAIEKMEQAIELLNSVRAELRIYSYRAGFWEGHQQLVEEMVTLLHGANRPVTQIAYWVERFKSRALADLLVDHSADETSGSRIQRLLAKRDEVARRFDSALALQGMAGDGTHTSIGERTEPQTQLAALRAELQQIDDDIARQHDVTLGWRAGESRSPSEIGAALNKDTLFISFYGAEDALYALVQSGRDQQIHRINLTVSESEVARFWRHSQRRIARPTTQTSDTTARLSRLWEWLIGPLAAHCLRHKRLIIAPHRALFHIPFAALFDKEKKRFMSERWMIQIVPSGTLWLHCQGLPGGHAPPLIVGYAGEEEEADYLPALQQEVDMLQATLPTAEAYVGDEATRARLLKAMSGRRLVHLAGHISYATQHPLESGMRLAEGRWIRAADLFARFGALAGSSIVLSGCESGVGEPAGGDVLGLISAFLYAGAPAILATLWPVDDEATAAFMAPFYAALLRGEDGAMALQAAQAALRADSRYAAPYYWAPFMLNGDSRQLFGME